MAKLITEEDATGGGASCPAVAFAVRATCVITLRICVRSVFACAFAGSADCPVWSLPGIEDEFIATKGFDSLPECE